MPTPSLNLVVALFFPAIGKVSFAYWGSALALAIAAELVAAQRRTRSQDGPGGFRAGDLGLDPLGLADDEVRSRLAYFPVFFFFGRRSCPPRRPSSFFLFSKFRSLRFLKSEGTDV